MPTLLTYADWRKNSDAGRFSLRGSALSAVDEAYAAYDKFHGSAELKALDLAFKNYRRKNPGWTNSAANRMGALNRLHLAIAERVDILLDSQDFIWCPGIDKEMTECSENFIQHLHLSPRLYGAGQGGLEKFGAGSTCYVLAHGHAEFPVFSTKKGKWTAEQLARMLVDSGLNPDIKFIQMLVCHAGESVNNLETGSELYRLWLAYRAADGNAKKQKVILAAYEEAKKKGSAPTIYHDQTVDWFQKTELENEERMERQSKQVLPMSAQLTNALKQLGVNSFILTSYMAPVNQDAGPKEFLSGHSPAGVRLDLTAKRREGKNEKLNALERKNDSIAILYASARDYPEYVATWR